MDSLTLYSAFLLVLVRPSNPTFTQLTNYQKLSLIRLLDVGSKPIGYEFNDQKSAILNLQLPGWIFNVKQNIYVIPFAASIGMAKNGSETGFTEFNGNFTLNFETEGTISAGNYDISIISYDYNTLMIEEGNISVKKN